MQFFPIITIIIIMINRYHLLVVGYVTSPQKLKDIRPRIEKTDLNWLWLLPDETIAMTGVRRDSNKNFLWIADSSAGDKSVCWKFLQTVKHIQGQVTVACDTSHPISLPHRWPAAYVCRMHRWIPNQTLSGVITAWEAKLLWRLWNRHPPPINEFDAAASFWLCSTTVSCFSLLVYLLWPKRCTTDPAATLSPWTNEVSEGWTEIVVVPIQANQRHLPCDGLFV